MALLLSRQLGRSFPTAQPGAQPVPVPFGRLIRALLALRRWKSRLDVPMGLQLTPMLLVRAQRYQAHGRLLDRACLASLLHLQGSLMLHGPRPLTFSSRDLQCAAMRQVTGLASHQGNAMHGLLLMPQEAPREESPPFPPPPQVGRRPILGRVQRLPQRLQVPFGHKHRRMLALLSPQAEL